MEAKLAYSIHARTIAQLNADLCHCRRIGEGQHLSLTRKKEWSGFQGMKSPDQTACQGTFEWGGE